MKGREIMNRLKELRQEKKLSQKELAEKIGVHYRTLQNWENGESQIKPDKAQALADYFGVSVAFLLGFADNYKTGEITNQDTQEMIKIGADYFEMLTSKKALEYLENYIGKTKKWPRFFADADELGSEYPAYEWLVDFYQTMAISPRDVQIFLAYWALLNETEKDAVLSLMKKLTEERINQLPF